MKYTAVIPYYKGRGTLPICLSSFIANKSHLEKIIISKDSDDDITDIVEYFSKFFNIEIVDVPKERSNGPGVTRQVGLEKVTTPYVVFCDQDDCYYPFAIDKMFNILKASSTPLGVVYGRVEKINPDTQYNCEQFNCEFNENSWKNTNLVNGALWSMDFIREANLQFHPKMYMIEDIYFNSLVNIYFDKYGFDKWDYCITPFVTYSWTTNPTQFSTIHLDDFWVTHLTYFYKRFLYTYEILDINEPVYYQRIRRHCYSVLMFSYCYVNKAINQGATEEQLKLYFTYLKRLMIIFKELTNSTDEEIYQEMIKKINEENEEIQRDTDGIIYDMLFDTYWEMLINSEPISMEEA